MLAEHEIEGRFVWMATAHDKVEKIHAFYYDDKKARKEALAWVSARTYDYEEHRAEVCPDNDDHLVYRKVK